MRSLTHIAVLLLVVLICGCGSAGDATGSGGGDSGDSGGSGDSDDGEILTEKLVGTPFEGRTTGDDFGWREFREGIYLTVSVDAVPIPVFLAYFTAQEEERIQAGIDIANTAVGFDVFETISTWQDDARAIYKVERIGDPEMGFDEELFEENPAVAMTSLLFFDESLFSNTVVCDWIVELRDDGVDQWTVAHELGHAMGLDHFLIDYEADELLPLEEDSLMTGDIFPDNPQLTDYNFMMEMQGDILMEHLGEGAEAMEIAASINF